MTWASDQHYPGGEVIYVPLPDCDKYMIIYRHSTAGDFYRGFITAYELMARERKDD